MSAIKTHIFDLPPEMLDQIFLRMDYESLDKLMEVCHYLKDRVNRFRDVYKKEWEQKRREHAHKKFCYPDDTDEELYQYSNSDQDDDDELDYCDINDIMDRLSFGSNYDEELHDYVFGAGGDDEVGAPQD